MSKLPLIAVIGPTASGKSELAVALAKQHNGEIVSADSRQVYRGLDIGTGKVKGHWKGKTFFYKSIPHHCIDKVSPKTQYSAADFVRIAKKAVADIHKHGKIPIIAGGTGFWIDALVWGMPLPDVPPNKPLRRKLEKKKPEELFSLLKKLDPARAENIDPHNPRRLIRAIEIAETLGKSPRVRKKNMYRTLWIGIAPDTETLKLKIKKRLVARLRRGMIQEAKVLRKQGISWKRLYALGLEYRFLADLLQKKISKKEMREQMERAIWQYAKRQLTWFKRNKEVRWIKGKNEAMTLADAFLRS